MRTLELVSYEICAKNESHLLEPYVKVSLHTAPDILTLRFC